MVQVELLESRANNADVEATAKILADEASRLDRLVDDLLLLAKSDEQALVIEHRDVDLDDLLLSEAKRLRQIGRVEVNAKAVSPVRVVGDPELLRRALRNLVDNAERYATSTVTFQASLGKDGATVVIADDGKGVPEELRATLFNRFSRGDSSRVRGTGGTGLGLAIVAQIIALHEGTVEVSNEGPGAHFVIHLPADVDVDDDDDDYDA
jgi:signal transduction histidine kinase